MPKQKHALFKMVTAAMITSLICFYLMLIYANKVSQAKFLREMEYEDSLFRAEMNIKDSSYLQMSDSIDKIMHDWKHEIDSTKKTLK